MSDSQLVKVRPRERTAILQSLAAGVVPAIGLHLIQVGRNLEIRALGEDLIKVEEGGATVRFVIGRFGTGKSFLLNLVKSLALERGHLVMQADITPDRRFHSSGGQARALYTELMNNTCTRANPQGGGLAGAVERFVAEVANEVGDVNQEVVVDAIWKRLESLREMTMGVHFVRVLAVYVQAFLGNDDQRVFSAMRWLRGEYTSKTEAKNELGIREIVQDDSLYPMLKVWAEFAKAANYKGLLVSFDELVVLSERLNHGPSREKNYELLLVMLNDCLQGRAGSLGLCFAGTDDFLTNERRGLASYAALKTRLAENRYAQGVVDMSGPVIRLQALTAEELYLLLERISIVHANGDPKKSRVTPEDLRNFVIDKRSKLGAESFLTPRESVKDFVSILNLLDQYPERSFASFLSGPRGSPGVSAGTQSNQSVLEGFNLGGP